MEEFNIHWVLVDNGSLADIIYLPTFQQMKLSKEKLRPFTSPLISFTRDNVIPKGVVKLTIIAGTYPAQFSKEIDFLVVDCPSTYNVILGRPTLNKLKAATSTYYLKMKFPATHGVGEIRGDQILAREWYQAALASGENHTWMTDEPEPVPKPSEMPQKVEVVPRDSSKVLKIGLALSALEKTKITKFLRENQDVFAWKHEDMPGINREVIQHRLNVNPECKLVQQQWRIFLLECNKAIAKEVEKLLKAGFIREVFYPEWLANVVIIKKKNGKWRMCVDFIDLNKIMMDKEDQEKIVFITSRRLYCYKVMPFGLKNAGVTYQRLGNSWDSWYPNRGIKANVDKIKAIMEIKSPKTVKEVQSLKGKVAILNKFVS
ncbi:uncharacterized protein LOC115964655 [Quercus lobata]|uniref:uncharacterized protein LOC115964655 n=1 Tax=Quercus lobata TaxID=97700 RepID=UPI0012456358|nr:uncharacterized protein LOC115964655 [Quercus lobata]